MRLGFCGAGAYLVGQAAQSLVNLGSGKENRIIRSPYLQRGGEKLNIAYFGSMQLVDNPEYAMDAHVACGGDLAQKIVAGQEDAVLLASCRNKGEAIIG